MQRFNPTNLEIFKDKFSNITSGIVAVLCTIATSLWGGWDLAMETLVIFMFLDYVTGVLGGKIRQELSSMSAFEGIIKKIIILVLVAVSYRVDLVVGADGGVRTLITYFFIGQEGISILENAAVIGVPIPDFLKDSLIQLQKGQKKDITEE